MNNDIRDATDLLAENAALRVRLEEAEDTLAAIHRGDVDALIVGGDIYTLDRANAATNKLRKDVLAQMEDAVLAFDLSDNVIFMNPAAERQYGRSASAMLGSARSDVFEERWLNSDDVAACQRALQQTGAYRASTVHIRSDGQVIHVESTVSTLRDAGGQALGHLAVIRNIGERVQAEETLRAATLALARREQQFSTLVENSPDIFVRMNRDLRFSYVSPIVERYSGRSAADFIGRTAAELGAPDELVHVSDTAHRKVFETGGVGRIKFNITTVQGEERIFDTRLIPELAEDGTVESVLAIASDVTEQELANIALRESQARLQFTLDSARIGDWEFDPDTNIVHTSLGHDHCFGYTEPVLQWSRHIMLAHVHEDDRGRVQAAITHSLAAHGDLHFECRVVWQDQTVHWIEMHGGFYGGASNSRRMVGIVFDITDHKFAEESLRMADRRKDEFLATLAHELRNPLAPISNALQVMNLTGDATAHVNARRIIERQVQQMVHLVDDLLDVSRISRGKVELRWQHIDIVNAVQTAIETTRPLMDGWRHELTVHLPAPGTLIVNADITRLSQIIANLLNNAAKYTPEGGHIEIDVRRDKEFALITVQDNGVGIPAEMLPRVFDMFAQVDRSRERAQGGLGIGLALVKKLVEMHGGSVEVHSGGAGLGCRFTIAIPLIMTDSAEVRAEVSSAVRLISTNGFRVLVVDDNVDSAQSLAQVLTMLGYQTCTVHDGAEALQAAETFSPRAALLDLGLPDISGLEVARQIRQLERGKELLLIALSGWGQVEDRRRSQDAGFDYHFVKPVDIKMLTDLLAQRHGHDTGMSRF